VTRARVDVARASTSRCPVETVFLESRLSNVSLSGPSRTRRDDDDDATTTRVTARADADARSKESSAARAA